jgi:hypothetical protein
MILTPVEAEALLKCCPKTLSREANAGKIPRWHVALRPSCIGRLIEGSGLKQQMGGSGLQATPILQVRKSVGIIVLSLYGSMSESNIEG